MQKRATLLGLLAAAILLSSTEIASPYLPPAVPGDDFTESDLIVIGRVTGIERFRSTYKRGEKEAHGYFYLATITVGKTLKGDAKPGDDISLLVGFGMRGENDNVHAGRVMFANDQFAWPLEIDNAYLVCLCKTRDLEHDEIDHAEVRRDGAWQAAHLEKRDIWEPRRYHASVHRVTSYKDPLKFATYLETDPKHSVPSVALEELKAMSRRAADDAKKDKQGK